MDPEVACEVMFFAKLTDIGGKSITAGAVVIGSGLLAAAPSVEATSVESSAWIAGWETTAPLLMFG